jgi:TonB-linked SusC/RagA family outer membrane protein
VLLASVQTFAQNVQVTGRVVGEDGNPIVGAVVMVSGTQQGVTTDASGNYAITAPARGILEFSLLGMISLTEEINGRTQINAKLIANAEEIEVVVAYGSAPRKAGTVIGSVDKVDAAKLADRPSTSIMDAMQGQVAGLSVMTSSGEPDALSTFRLHGIGTLNTTSSKEPLILLDGSPITTGTLLAMNSSDIESINVLKDASSTSIYGSSAANGVIYVVSKLGRRNVDEGVKVTLKEQYSVSTVAKPRLQAMSTNQYTQYLYDLGVIDQNDMAELNAFGDTDWFNEIYQPAPMNQVDLSVTGGSEKTAYHFSGSYLNQDGVTQQSGMTRYTFRANVESQAQKWLRTGANIGLSYYNSTNSQDVDNFGNWFTNPANGAILIPHYQTAYDENGEEIQILDYTGGYPSPLVFDNLFPRNKNRLQLNGSTFVQLTPIENLNIRSNLAVNAFDNNTKNTSSPDYVHANGSGWVQQGWQRNYNWTLSNTIEYKFRVAEDHSFIALAGQEGKYSNSEYTNLRMMGVKDSRFMYLNQGVSIQAPPPVTLTESAYYSFFGRVDYDFREKYYVDFSLRTDRDSRFGKNRQAATFYSAGVMWNLKKENFLQNADWLSRLSMKFSTGTSGNSNIGEYAQYATLAATTYDGKSGWNPDSAGNSNLGWESQRLSTLGIHAGFWNKLNIEIDLYDRKTSDMLLNKPVPRTSGFATIASNVGEMVNRGIDLTIDYTILRNKNWLVSTRGTFNYNHNEVTSLFDGLEEYPYDPDGFNIMKIGHTIGEWKLKEYMGVDPATGDWRWNDGKGGYTNDFDTAPYIETGKSWFAPYTAGWNFTATWRGLTFSMDWTGVFDKWMWNNTLYFSENPGFADGSVNQSTGALNYWKKAGDNARYPALSYGYDMPYESTHMLEDGSFIRLKNLTLSYALPKSVLKKTGFLSDARVFVGGRNLVTITKYNGLDPEVDAMFTLDNYPNTRQYTFGIELTF